MVRLRWLEPKRLRMAILEYIYKYITILLKMGRIIRIEEGWIRKLFEGVPSVVIDREEVLHVSRAGEHMVSLYPDKKYAEFDEDLRDPSSHGPGLRPLMDYLEREGYETNLK